MLKLVFVVRNFVTLHLSIENLVLVALDIKSSCRFLPVNQPLKDLNCYTTLAGNRMILKRTSTS